MPNSLVIGDDDRIAAWVFQAYRINPFKYNRVYGVMSQDRILVGAIILHNFNGANLELSYYGTNTLSAGIVRALSRMALTEFNPSRCTLVISKRNKRLMRSLDRFGCKLEGVQRRYYGHIDMNRNTGVRFVLFKEQIEVLAGFTNTPHKQGQG